MITVSSARSSPIGSADRQLPSSSSSSSSDSSPLAVSRSRSAIDESRGGCDELPESTALAVATGGAETVSGEKTESESDSVPDTGRAAGDGFL